MVIVTPLMLLILGFDGRSVSESGQKIIFDLSQKMACIPLDEEMKVKRKAIVEIVDGRFGEASGR
jgi:AAA family ATP:ADP antiporter